MDAIFHRPRTGMLRHDIPIAVLILLLVLTGCASLTPTKLTPRGDDRETFNIHVQFANALNLPANARVVSNGAVVGRLDSVAVVDPVSGRPGYVSADLEINQGTRLPTNTIAQLRQETILGDIHIALDSTGTSHDSTLLAAGDTIPLERTRPPLQIEDVLAGLATFVSGGALQSAQDTIRRINAVLPSDPAETRRISDVLKADVVDVARDRESVGGFLNSLDRNAQLVIEKEQVLDEILTPAGAVTFTEVVNSLVNVLGVLGSLGGIAHAMKWLAPLVTNADAAAKAFVPMLLNNGRPLDVSAPSNLAKLTDLIQNKLIPWVERPVVNVTGVHQGSKRQGAAVSNVDQTDEIVNVMRMIGLVR